ncbi:MAG TPA: neutral/alkaline non-lysosomal ceramidase N-terminal domain-containing protein [Gemmataceae bacterium]|nr:neutral/alkaline non-lysosomal ceramidase N-terminal domain-containing protein [Gemmataceae bacterium]
MRHSTKAAILISLAAANAFCPGNAKAQKIEAEIYQVGVAQVDITPDYPIRLSGFGFRRTESEGVTQRIWAKALAIEDKSGKPVVLITVDNCGVPAYLLNELALRLEKKAGLLRDHLSVTATHTHTAPMLKGMLATLFGVPIPKDHQERIDRYTAEFADKLERLALAALADRKPNQLLWGIGTVGFAANRRTKNGPVDHDLPVLVVRDPKGMVRAIYVSYACHCVTLSNNKISGDWAGFAQQAIQDDNPGAVALISIGCGADANPEPRGKGDDIDLAQRQGAAIAREVKRLVAGYMVPIHGCITTAWQTIQLSLVDPPTRGEWAERGKRQDAVGYHAIVQLDRLDHGEALKTKIDYPIQSWKFGDGLAMVFLPGEVVVDYGLRLKRELDSERIWINAYANDDPCYIPSERILREGGYEGGGAMIYYDVPGPFKPGLEEKIITAVRNHVGREFLPPFDPKKTQALLSPQQSLTTIRTKANLQVDLVAAEPLVASPVAIDFGPDGRLWVAEMLDYPEGIDGKYKPGGRIRVLESTRGDGVYDKATVFLENLPFPTGVTVWRNGVLICAAPDVIYAEDSHRDGKADVVRKLFTGFGVDNFQARVNGLEYGLDNWVYGSCGLFGGKIKSLITGETIVLGDRDFRIQPDKGILEPATGRTQQGRVRDDWGNWFGCDNSNLCWHYPLADHYLRRNPQLAPPDSAVLVPGGEDPNRLYPIRSQVQLFKLSGPPNRTTAACGIGVYRDDLLGPEYRGNSFTCEPVNLLVHRLQLTPKGSTFTGHRAADEQQSEFLASSDSWFRPVQARTGPDGCLWIVDMHRYVIEHPRWIPPEDLAKVDTRAGSTLGRIYRVRPKNQAPRPIPRLDKLDTAGLVAALDSPNGWQRDMAGQMLIWRNDKASVPDLARLARTNPRPEARLHALCLLDGLEGLGTSEIVRALADAHPAIRRHAVRLSEKFFIVYNLGNLIDDPDGQVRLQLACSLGAWSDRRAGAAMGSLALHHSDDPYLTAAVLSSINRKNVSDFLLSAFWSNGKSPPEGLTHQLVSIATELGDDNIQDKIILLIAERRNGRFERWQMAAFAGLLESLSRQKKTLEKLAFRELFMAMLAECRRISCDPKASELDRIAAIGVLGRQSDQRDADLTRLAELLSPQNSAAVQSAALAGLGRMSGDRVADVLISGWSSQSPSLKSQALDLLLSRKDWQRKLLSALEHGQIPSAHIDAARRLRLLENRDTAIRTAAAKLFEGSANSDRQKIVKDFRDVIAMTGDSHRGKEAFIKHCSVCHRLQDVGFVVGPDLAALANKSPEYLLTSILDPSKEVDSRYIEYLATTKAGRTFTGILASETATSVTLKGQEGKELVLLRADLEDLQSTGKSLMPEGLEKDLSKQDLADVMAYVAQAGTPPKILPGNRPALVKAENDSLRLLATNAEIHGGDITFESTFQNIGCWHDVQDHAVWTVQLEKAGRFEVVLDYACDDTSAGNRFILEGGQPSLRGQVVGTGGWDKYRQQKIGILSLAAGTQHLVLRPDAGSLKGALLDLRGIYLTPEKQRKP